MPGSSKNMLPVWIGFSLLVSVLLLLLPFLPALLSSTDYYGMKRQQDVSDFSLPATSSAQLNLVFFGYLQCGTVCPKQLLNLKILHERLQGESLNFIFVSLDPERDTPTKLRTSMTALGDNFHWLRPANRTEAQTMARIFAGSAVYRPEGDRYEIDHSGFLYVVDANAQLQLIYTSPALDLSRVEQDLMRLIPLSEKGKEL